MIVFPFYTAISVQEGVHDITFAYEPSVLKRILIALALSTIVVLIARYVFMKR